MSKSIQTLKEDAIRIKNETAKAANTAQRVGSLFEDIIDLSGEEKDSRDADIASLRQKDANLQGQIDIISAMGGGGSADKNYDPINHSGLGRVTLKLKDDGNKLSQADFTKANTIYVIPFDFDLDGQTINMPSGCLLEFAGGSISNGKLKSDNTIILGNRRGDALYGVYLDSLGAPLSYNYKQVKNVRPSFEHAYTPHIKDTSKKRVTQSIAVFRFSGNKYIAVFHEDGDVGGGIFVFDEYYNLVKYVELEDGENSHFNDATVKGFDILIADYMDTSKGIRRIRIEDLMNTADGGQVPSDHLGLLSDQKIVSLDYDATNDELAIFPSGDSILIYDGSGTTLINRVDNFREKIVNKVGEVTYQGMLYRNGQIVFPLWATQLSGGTFSAGAIPVIFDQKTNNVYALPYEGVPYGQTEIEGVCKDPDNPSFYWNAYHLWLDGWGSTSRSAIAKHSFDEEFNGVSNHLSMGQGSISEGTNTDVYISASGTQTEGVQYIPNGSTRYPFKTIDSAMVIAGVLSGRVRFHMGAGDYYVGDYAVVNRYMQFIGASKDTTFLHGKWTVRAGHLEFDALTLINDFNTDQVISTEAGSFIDIDNVIVTRSTKGGSAISLGSSEAQITNTTFDNFDDCILVNGGIFNRFRGIHIKNCDYVIWLNRGGKCLDSQVHDQVTFDAITGDDTRKLIREESILRNGPFFQITTGPTNFPSVMDYINTRVRTAGNGIYNSRAVEVFVYTDFTCVCSVSDGVTSYVADKVELDEGEVRVNINRGVYYHNGYNLVSVDGRRDVYATSQPDYPNIPRNEFEVGTMFFDQYDGVPAIYGGIAGFLKLMLSSARNYVGTLDTCREPGLFLFSTSNGFTPDLGSSTSSSWYYVFNFGRTDILQIVFQHRGTKFLFRNWSSDTSTWGDSYIIEGTAYQAEEEEEEEEQEGE